MKNFNLTQMLQGCSRSNEMTVSASNSGGGQTCQVKQQTRLTSVEEKWSEKEALSSTCLRSASDALSFRSRYLRYAAVIFCVLAMSMANIGMAWGTDYYLRYMKSMPAGNYDGNTSQKLTRFGSTNRYYCELDLSGSSSYGFFIRVDNSNTKCWKADATANTNQEIELYSYSGEHGNSNHRVSYTTGSAGTYIFTYDISNHKISVSPKSSQTVKVAWDVASGHDGNWNLDNYTTLTQEGTSSRYSADVDLTKVKHYMFVQTDNNRYWKNTATMSAGTYAYVYDYGTDNYGGSGDKNNFTPPAAGKYRFIWDHDAKMVKFERVYSLTYNGNGSTSGSVPVAEAYYLSGTNVTVANNSGNLKKTGYVFVGWNTSSTGNGKYFPEGSTITTTAANTTLYAMWLQVHEPSGIGNTYYGQALTQVSDDYYEVYRYATSSSTLHINAGTSNAPTTSGTRVVLSVSGCGSSTKDSTYAATTWMAHSVTYGVGTATPTASYEFPNQNVCEPAIRQGQGYVLVVTGYDQFSLYAKDANTSGDKKIHVYINGVDKTNDNTSGTTPSTSFNVRRYNLNSGDVSTIRVQAHDAGTSCQEIGFSLRVPATCSATQPGEIGKGTLSGCSLPLTAAGSPAANNTWYWQTAEDGEDKTGTRGATKDVTSAGTYYIRSFCSVGAGCWSDVRSVVVSASDLTPAAPTALTKSSITAKGVTLTVEDVANTNDYEFYVSTSNTAPTSGSTATHSKTDAKSITITNLVAGTQYYAWARAKCGSNKSTWTALGDGGNFTTSTVTVTHTLTNVEKTSGEETAGGSDYTAVFAAVSGYSMPTPTVTVGGSTLSAGNYTWTPGTGTLTIPAGKINGNIVITLNSVPSAPSSAVISGAYHYFPGENISLTVTPSGNNGPTTYQWYKGGTADGNAIEGATNPTYTKASCTYDDAGSYYCKVTCGGSLSRTSSNFDVKILRLYVNGSRDGEAYGNVDFVSTGDDATATASISLGSGWTYGFSIADGCGNYYGNSGTMTEANHSNWTMDRNNSGQCAITTTNAATYTFTVTYYENDAFILGAPKVSVSYPAANQAADKVIYFDNSVLSWAVTPYYRIGHSTHSQATAMTKVSGTANLYKVMTSEYNGFSGWFIANAEGGTGSEKSIYNTVNAPAITKATAHEGGAVTADAVTVTPTTSKGAGADAGVNDNCTFYNYTITTGMKSDRVAISPYSNGTITVNYTNTSGSAATLTSGNADLAHSVILTSITAVADEGYDASAITINGGDYSANYVVTGNTTIAASFTLKTYTISYNKGTNGTGSKASETKTHGVNFTLPGSTFTYGGHAQDGWSTSDGGALAYALSGSYTTNAAQEFFPHWKCNTPTITDNGDNTVSITVPSGTTVRYTTDGTNPSSSTGTVYSTPFSIAADCTVKAIAYQSNCTDSEIASQDCDYTAPADFMMVATTSGSDASLSHNESISASSKNCATLTGGSAKYLDEDKSDKQTMTVKSGESYGWNFNRNKDHIVITLSGHVLQEGSVITVSGYANADKAGFKMNGVTIFSKTSGSGSFADQSYTVLSTDEALINKNVLTLTRNSGSGAYLHSITISNCASGTPCVTPVLPSLTTPNQACTTGDFAAWDASVTNSAAISAASGSQAVSYSWKNSSSVEVGTYATFTPTAAGTYTVTATVHSETSGYIDATATSSTLTASLYGNPSVTGPSDANYVVGASASNLSVTATPTHGESLTYQWYSNTAKSTSSPTPTALANCTTSTYKPSTAAAGTTYYFCKVSGGCEDVYSSIATVTVTEAPCFTFTCSSQTSEISSISSGSSITTSSWESGKATLTGGTMTNSGSGSLGVNRTYGLVFDSNDREVTITLSGDNVLAKDAVITLSCYSLNDDSKSYGFKINGNNMSPATYTPTADSYETFTQSYTIPTASALIGTKSFKITRYNSNKVYLNGITVTGCDECEGITPSLSYSKTTLWVNDGDTSTPTLDTDESTGSVTYSSSNTDVATVNESTGVVRAVAGGNVTITASIAADGTHCANTATCNLTIKHADCSGKVIVGVTATGGSAGTLEGLLKNTASGGYSVNLGSNTADAVTYDGYKIDKKKYMYVALSSGNYFQDGDTVHVGIAKLSDIGSASGLYIYAGGKVKGDCVGYKLNANLTANATTAADNIIILSNVPANTDTITIYRTDNQNAFIKYMKVNRFICTDCLGFVDATENGNWNTAGNWIGSTGVSASVPTISDRVHIYKPVTVDINNAKASSVYIYTNSTNTGKVTIDAGKALIIAGKLAKSSDGTNYTNTAAADVIINSTRAVGVGALVIGGETGANQATVNFATKAKNDGGWVNQFIGSPFSDNKPYVDYALQLYKFVPRANGDRGWWSTVHEGDEMEEFWGYNVLYNDASELDVTWTGTLNASESKTISGLYYNGSSETDNMFANSWTAPIHVGAIEDADLPNASKTLYMFNAGTPAQEEGHDGSNAANNNSDPGTYISIPIHSATYAGIGVIPSMQAFYVEATSSDASITLDYNKIVYTPALTSVGIVPNRAPKYNAEVVEPEVIKLHVQSETGWGANTYVLGRADFAEGYEDGWDGAYIEGESATPKLYTPSIDGNMFINCLPEIEGTVVGFRKGSSDNNYIFSFDYDGDEVWYLNDQKAQKSTQIMNGQTYAFVSDAGDNAARFVISATPINKIATGCESVGAEAAKVRKLIINDKVYIIRGGQVFDVLGKTIKK